MIDKGFAEGSRICTAPVWRDHSLGIVDRVFSLHSPNYFHHQPSIRAMRSGSVNRS